MMTFLFENGCQRTEALVTALIYDQDREVYELTVLGLGRDGFSYTEPGKVWFYLEEDFNSLMESGDMEFPQEIIGRRIRLVADSAKERVNGDDNEEN